MFQRKYTVKSNDNTLEEPKGLSSVEFMERTFKDRSVRLVDFTVPYRPNVCLYDLSLDPLNQGEEKVYALNRWYHANVRKGNTVIQTFDENDKPNATFYGRKGLEKFFDLKYEYLQYNIGESQGFDKFGDRLRDEHYKIYNAIFGQVQGTFDEGNQISVYKLSKANGENAQISWVSQLNAWLIASDNVSILANEEKDIGSYTGPRFQLTKLIAKEWFKILERVSKNNLLDELKEEMTGKTFIGEFCGLQDYRYLVKYPNVGIQFFAIVGNESSLPCMSPAKAFSIFEKFSLEWVKFEEVGTYESWDPLNKDLENTYIEVQQGSIETEGEGSVLYITQVDPNGNESVLSLSMLRTLEYRIYRKLREKLKSFIEQETRNRSKWQVHYEKFCNEIENLCKYIKPNTELDHIFDVAKAAFLYVKDHFQNSSLIYENYAIFLSLLMYCMSNGKELTPSLFEDKDTVEKVMETPWSEFYTADKPKNFAQSISARNAVTAKVEEKGYRNSYDKREEKGIVYVPSTRFEERRYRTSFEERKEKGENSISRKVEAKNAVYDPATTPFYLGLFTKGNPITEIKDYILQGLNVLTDVYPQDHGIVGTRKEIRAGTSPYLSFVEDFYITSLFIGRNYQKKQTEYFRTFRPGYKLDVDIEALVIVPNKIVIGICYPDQSEIKIENEIPHMILMKGQWPPRVSNDVVEEIFGKGGVLSKEYESKGFAKMGEFAYKCSVKVPDEGWGNAYVVRAKPHLRLATEAKAVKNFFRY